MYRVTYDDPPSVLQPTIENISRSVEKSSKAHPFYWRLSKEQVGMLHRSQERAPKNLKPRIIVELSKENKYKW